MKEVMKEKLQELASLIQTYPELPVKFVAHNDMYNDEYTYGVGTIRDAYIDEYVYYQDTYYFLEEDKDRLLEDIMDNLEDAEEVFDVNMPVEDIELILDEEANKVVNELEKHKCIVVFID